MRPGLIILISVVTTFAVAAFVYWGFALYGEWKHNQMIKNGGLEPVVIGGMGGTVVQTSGN